jgi:hypothetical protein
VPASGCTADSEVSLAKHDMVLENGRRRYGDRSFVSGEAAQTEHGDTDRSV